MGKRIKKLKVSKAKNLRYKKINSRNIKSKKLIKKKPKLLKTHTGFKKIYLFKNSSLQFYQPKFKLKILSTVGSILALFLYRLSLFFFFFKIFNIYTESTLFLIKLLTFHKPQKFYMSNKLKVLPYKTFKRLISLKLHRLRLERIIFFITRKTFKVHLKSLLMIKLPIDFIVIPEMYFRKHKYIYFLVDFLKALTYAVVFRSSSLLSIFISRNITNKKKHYIFLKKVKRILTDAYNLYDHLNLKGLLIKVHGKFQGKLRKRKLIITYGCTGMSSFNDIIDYDLKVSFTKYGTFSTKVFMFFKKHITNYII